MKTRFTVNDRGELVSRDGEVLGKVTSLTIERTSNSGGKSGDSVGYRGESVVVEEPTTNKENTPLTPRQRIWAYYQELFGTRYELTPVRVRVIDYALKVRDEERIKRAIYGLRHSRFHNGDNADGKKYLDIRYAIGGNSQKRRDADEWIDHMAEAADAFDAQTQVEDASPIPTNYDESIQAMLRTALSNFRRALADGDDARAEIVMAHLPRAFNFEQRPNGEWRIVEA